MQFNHHFIFLTLVISACLCSVACADITEDVAQKILQAKIKSAHEQQQLSDELERIHAERTSHGIESVSPTSVSSVQDVANMDFIQTLRRDLVVIGNLNAARARNAAKEAAIQDTIWQIEDETRQTSFQNRLNRLAFARAQHDNDAEKELGILSELITEIDPSFPEITPSTSSSLLLSRVNEVEKYIRNNPFSLKDHSHQVTESFTKMKVLLGFMDTLSEEFTSLERELLV
jgi:hypothetical protein